MKRFEGQRPRPQIVVIVEWPSREAADAFYQSDEYRPFRDKRMAGAKNEFLVVAGTDVSKLARIE